MKITRALISVSDKTGVAQFARALERQGIDIISTGGTAELLRKENVPVREISSFTAFPVPVTMAEARLSTSSASFRFRMGCSSVPDSSGKGVNCTRAPYSHFAEAKDHFRERDDSSSERKATSGFTEEDLRGPAGGIVAEERGKTGLTWLALLGGECSRKRKGRRCRQAGA